MRKWYFLVALLAVSALVLKGVEAQDTRRLKSTIINSAHDMRDLSGLGGGVSPDHTVCSFCHTPHQPPTANALDPLWNHTLSSVSTYGVYDSDTLDAVPEELGGNTTQSNLCLSCHDGSVAVNSQYNQGSIVASPQVFMPADAQIGANADTHGLTDDHPVNFVYDATLAGQDGGLLIPVNDRYVDADGDIPLFGAKMQCTSCHDAHNGGPGPFLRRRISTNVTLCLECHA